MCGIVYVRRLDGKSPLKMVKKSYRMQIGRGTEGFGFVSLGNGIVRNYLRSSGEQAIMAALDEQEGADEILFHHRNPSSTVNVWECAHPIRVSLPDSIHDYYVVHNGVIGNADELKRGHDADKIPYSTLLRGYWLTGEGNVIDAEDKFNDSEALAIELARDLEGEQRGIPKIRGSAAFIVLKAERGTGKAVSLYWGRNAGNPLNVLRTKEYIAITSAGKGVEIPAHRLGRLDYATGDITESPYDAGISYAGYSKPADKGSYWNDKGGDGDEDADGTLVGKALPSGSRMPERDIDEWMDAVSELESLRESLGKETDKTTIDFLELQIEELEAVVKGIEEKYPVITPAS